MIIGFLIPIVLRRLPPVFAWATARLLVSLILAGIVLGILISLWIIDTWYFSWDYSIAGQFYHQRFAQCLAGFLVGFFLSVWRSRRALTGLRAGVLLTLFIVGLGPSYWGHFLDTLGIIRIGPAERVISQSEEAFDFPLFDDQDDDKHSSSDDLLQLAQAANMVRRDFNYMNSILPQPSLVGLSEALRLALDRTSMTVARCALEIERPLPSAIRVRTNPILLDFSLAFSRYLQTEEPNVNNEVDGIAALVKETLASLEQLGAAASHPTNDACVVTNMASDAKWRESIVKLVSSEKSFPYGAIAVAHIFNRVNDKEAALKVLHDWTEAYHQSTSVDRHKKWFTELETNGEQDYTLENALDDVQRVVFVRVLSSMALIAEGSEPAVESAMQQRYLQATQQLLESAEERGSVVSDASAVCKKTATNHIFDRVVLLELFIKNNYADATSKELANLLGRESVSSIELEELRFDRELARTFAEEVREYPLETCLTRFLGRRWVQYYRAAFLETSASLRTSLTRLDAKLMHSSRGEFVHNIRRSLREWSMAQGILEEQAPTDYDAQLIGYITNRSAAARTALYMTRN